MASDMKTGFSPNLSSSSEPSTVTMKSDTSSGATIPQQGAAQYGRANAADGDACRVAAAPSRLVHQPDFSRCDPQIDLGSAEGDDGDDDSPEAEHANERDSSTASMRTRPESPIDVTDSPETVDVEAVASLRALKLWMEAL